MKTLLFHGLWACAVGCWTLVGCGTAAAEPLPPEVHGFLSQYCLDCHSGDAAEAELDLQGAQVDWTLGDSRQRWRRVLDMLGDGVMPPPDADQPSAAQRASILAWIDSSLIEHSPIGGTALRRLNRREYEHTIRQLFGLDDFQTPHSFPPDNRGDGFDTVGQSLVLSPPLMEAYAAAATTIADAILPPPSPPIESQVARINASDMAIAYSSSSIRDGAMRLVSKSGTMHRSCSWPTKFEVKTSGIYKITVRLSAFRPGDDAPLQFQLRARSFGGSDGGAVSEQRLLSQWEVSSAEPESFQVEAELFAGETLLFYYADAPLDSDKDAADKQAFEDLLREKFTADRRLLAGWQAVKHDAGLRGGIGWQRVKALMASDDLDLSQADPDSKATEELIDRMLSNPVLYVETISYQHFEQGPGLDVHQATVEGPLRRVEDAASRHQQAIARRLLGARDGRGDQAYAKAILRPLLTQMFRRPVTDPQVDSYWQLIADHMAQGHDFRAGLHLAIRAALISPHFLYRELRPGPLDGFDLAARLSYFLTSRPPDPQLFAKAASGALDDPAVVQAEARRLLADDSAADFVSSFTGQWLQLDRLEDIMPDPRLGDFTTDDRVALRTEAEMFFAAMLRENRPMRDFIDPDFTYTNASVGQKIYGLTDGKKKSESQAAMRRVSLPPGGRYGGILGQAAVMMATANGVDTQPVLRGVWVLNNVLGDPPPPPPQAVPALTPDTSGATTVRQLLAAHTTEASCARCHRKIDPLGFALENFDPVGRWRTHYPVYTANREGKVVQTPGAAVDASGRMPDGTELSGVVDLKAYVVRHLDQFSRCLAEKLLVYATGRPLNHAEQKEVQAIVGRVRQQGNGFQDLCLALIQSETFRTK